MNMRKTIVLSIILILTIPVMSQAQWNIFRGDQQLLGVSNTKIPDAPKLLWSTKPGDGILASPVVSDGIIVVGSENGFIYALNSSGEKIWEFETDNAIEASALILDGTVFIGSLSGTLYALDLKSGRKKWEYLTENQIIGFT